MIAIEIQEDFIFDHFGDPALAHKLLPDAQVALFHVREIEIYDELDLVIHFVLEDVLDGRIIEFCHLDDSMGDLTALAIPVGDEILRLVHIPLAEVIVVLNPVFTEFSDNVLTSKPA